MNIHIRVKHLLKSSIHIFIHPPTPTLQQSIHPSINPALHKQQFKNG